MADLSEEEVFDNDKDPLEAIREIRREEGVPEEELMISDSDTPATQEDPVAEVEGEDELDNLQKPNKEETPSAEVPDEEEAEPDEQDEGEEEEDTAKSKKEEVAVVKRKFTANGQEFEFTDQEIQEQFGTVFAQSVDYTKKMQKIAPYRKMISALETEGVTSEKLNLAIDALKGNKNALLALMEENNIDSYDLTAEDTEDNNSYTPTEYGKNETQLGIEEISNSISSDPEYKITVDVVDNQWDQTSRDSLSSNPKMIQGLHNDIKSGLYDKVAPIAMKMKVLDGNTKSDIEYYMLAGQQVTAEQQNSSKNEQTANVDTSAQDAVDKFDQASSDAQRKRSASPTRTRADRKGVIDYLDDDDEAFDAWYKKLQASN